MPARPSSAPSSKRPWYLVAALVGGWVYGAQALGTGYEAIAFYRGEPTDLHAATAEIEETPARDVALAAGERWLELKESAQRRELPIGVATLLLGAAMVLLSARSMAGREGARSALVQVVLVQAGLVVVGYFLTVAVMHSQAEFQFRVVTGLRKDAYEPAILEQATRIFVQTAPLMQVAFQLAWSGLIVLALTRPRARQFFAESGAPPHVKIYVKEAT